MTYRIVARVAVIASAVVVLVMCVFSYLQPRFARQTISPASIIQFDQNGFIAPISVSLFHLPPSDIAWMGLGADHLLLFEEGRPLGPGKVIHAEIARKGSGAYSFWNGQLFFSSSDNSDPRSNGRRYDVEYALHCNPLTAGVAAVVLVLSTAGVGRTTRFAKRAFPRLVAVVIGLAFVVVPVEYVLRTDWARSEVLGSLGSYEKFPQQLRPTLNSLGFRDKEHEKTKPENVVRVVVFGDSMTFGHGLADGEIWPRRLANLARPSIEIITMAQNGWSTADEFDAFRRIGASFDPDAVVVGVVDNDLQPPAWEPSGQQQEWRIFTRLSESLDLFRWIDYIVNRIGDKFGLRYTYSQWLQDTYDPAKPYLSRWRATVAEFGNELRRQKVAAFAFILTSPIGPSDSATIGRYETLRAEFAAQGFHTVDLRDQFVMEFGPDGGKHLWAMPNDPHPGPEVNRFFAEAIWQVLREKMPER